MNSGVTSTEGNVTAWWDGLRLTETDVPLLDYGDTANVAFDIGTLPSGIQSIHLIVEVEGDENEANDTAEHEVRVSFESGLLLILRHGRFRIATRRNRAISLHSIYFRPAMSWWLPTALSRPTQT